jgi:hypothetical protein
LAEGQENLEGVVEAVLAEATISIVFYEGYHQPQPLNV